MNNKFPSSDKKALGKRAQREVYSTDMLRSGGGGVEGRVSWSGIERIL